MRGLFILFIILFRAAFLCFGEVSAAVFVVAFVVAAFVAHPTSAVVVVVVDGFAVPLPAVARVHAEAAGFAAFPATVRLQALGYFFADSGFEPASAARLAG